MFFNHKIWANSEIRTFALPKSGGGGTNPLVPPPPLLKVGGGGTCPPCPPSPTPLSIYTLLDQISPHYTCIGCNVMTWIELLGPILGGFLCFCFFFFFCFCFVFGFGLVFFYLVFVFVFFGGGGGMIVCLCICLSICFWSICLLSTFTSTPTLEPLVNG